MVRDGGPWGQPAIATMDRPQLFKQPPEPAATSQGTPRGFTRS